MYNRSIDRVTSWPLSRDRSATFFKNFRIAWNVEKTLFDSRSTVAWPPTTVPWPFIDFFQHVTGLLETSKKRCLTVGRRSRDFRPLSRDRSVTFFKNFPNCLKRPKTLFDSRPTVAWTSDLYRVTVEQFFSKIFRIAWNVEKTLFESRSSTLWKRKNMIRKRKQKNLKTQKNYYKNATKSDI